MTFGLRFVSMTTIAHLMFNTGKENSSAIQIIKLDQKKIPDLGNLVKLTVYGKSDNKIESGKEETIDNKLELERSWSALINDRFSEFNSDETLS